MIWSTLEFPSFNFNSILDGFCILKRMLYMMPLSRHALSLQTGLHRRFILGTVIPPTPALSPHRNIQYPDIWLYYMVILYPRSSITGYFYSSVLHIMLSHMINIGIASEVIHLHLTSRHVPPRVPLFSIQTLPSKLYAFNNIDETLCIQLHNKQVQSCKL